MTSQFENPNHQPKEIVQEFAFGGTFESVSQLITGAGNYVTRALANQRIKKEEPVCVAIVSITNIFEPRTIKTILIDGSSSSYFS